MSNADWYAQKLAELQGRGPAGPPVGAPQYPPTLPPGQLPSHLAPYATQPQAGLGVQGPAGTPLVGPQMPAGQHFYSYNAETGAQVEDDGHVALLYNSAAQTGGSKAVRENSTVCPNCNRDTLFVVQEGGVFSKLTGTTVKAQQCSYCNWPKIQSGSQGGSLATARSAGPAHKARQLPSTHRVTVAVEGGGYATFEPPTGAR